MRMTAAVNSCDLRTPTECASYLLDCADILRVMPSKAIELSAFDAYKKFLSREDEHGKLKRPGPLLTGLAGAAAGDFKEHAICFAKHTNTGDSYRLISQTFAQPSWPEEVWQSSAVPKLLALTLQQEQLKLGVTGPILHNMHVT